MKPDQLPLAMRWPQQQRFDSYLVGDNGAAVDLLQRAANATDAAWVFLNGAPASGKTHLLIAACAATGERGRSAQYISLRNLPQRIDATSAVRAAQDELPVGTAMVYLDEDGCSLPDDWYLQITAVASRYLKSGTVPPRELSAVLSLPSRTRR